MITKFLMDNLVNMKYKERVMQRVNSSQPAHGAGSCSRAGYADHTATRRQNTSVSMSIFVTYAAIAVLCSCMSKEDVERRDLEKLKTSMLRISRLPDEAMAGEIEKLKLLDLESDKVDDIRDDCYLAYRKLVLAAQKSREAEGVIGEIEKNISKKNIDPGVVLEMKGEAELLLSESNKLLGEADALKEKCHGKIEDMEKR
jgi:hypothetical protein